MGTTIYLSAYNSVQENILFTVSFLSLYKVHPMIHLIFPASKEDSPCPIGIGEGLTTFAFPHHRTYGSVYGGS
jgi:hypothetical protein